MFFNYKNNDYEVIIDRKRIKNLYIKVKDDLKIYVSTPFLYTNFIVKKLLNDNKKSVERMIDKQILKNKKSNDEANMYLGNKITICYINVKKPSFKDNILYVKDNLMKDKWYKNACKVVFKNSIDEIYNMFSEKIPYPKLKVRKMKTRWGVCNKRDNSVTLNYDLIKKDPKYLRYVVVHELSHFVHFNHSKSFWNTVCKYCPDYKIIRKELKE